MLTLSKKLAAGIAATTAVAAVAIAAPQAQATTFGTVIDFSFNGDRTGTAAATTLTTVGNAVAADPAEQSVVSSLLPGGTVFNLEFPDGFPGVVPNFRPVNLTSPLVLGGGSVNTTIVNNPQAGFRPGVAGTFSTTQFESDVFSFGGHLWKASLIFNSNTLNTFGGTGFVTAVPEPMTMLGASAAVAFGAAFKRRQAKKG